MYKYVKASLTSGLVGIWWITEDNKVIADLRTLDSGFNDGNYIQYDESKNHLSEWKRLVTQTFPETANDYLKLGYKGLERGRVIFNLKTRAYEITCSSALTQDLDKCRAIIDAFELKGCRYDFVPLYHYHLAPLTGNPALDKLEYGI